MVAFTDYMKLGKVIVVSSIYLKVSWASKLFSSTNTLMDQAFSTVLKANDPNVGTLNSFLDKHFDI